MIEALHSFGFDVNIDFKKRDGAIKSAFAKGNTSQHLLNIEAPGDIVKVFGQGRVVKVKTEVDTQPPLNFTSEKKNTADSITLYGEHDDSSFTLCRQGSRPAV